MGVHIVVAAALVRGDEVLLCHRSLTRRWYPNVWDFPGGHVEDGESPPGALRRELAEELSVDIGSVTGPPALALSDDAAGLDLSVWAVTSWEGEVRNAEPAEHDRVGWFAGDELDTLVLADDEYRPFLRRLLAHRSAVPFQVRLDGPPGRVRPECVAPTGQRRGGCRQSAQ